jgi:hypothetical protein
MKFPMFLVAILFATTLQAQEFYLNPGETLLSVDGVPVTPLQEKQGACGPGGCINNFVEAVLPPVINNLRPTVRARNGFPPLIGQGTAAYQHALREAQIIASRGANYYAYRDGGHPLGNAPGARYSGTGYTWDVNRPGHCWEDELPESRIIARARWQGINGAWFWSAHYR